MLLHNNLNSRLCNFLTEYFCYSWGAADACIEACTQNNWKWTPRELTKAHLKYSVPLEDTLHWIQSSQKIVLTILKWIVNIFKINLLNCFICNYDISLSGKLLSIFYKATQTYILRSAPQSAHMSFITVGWLHPWTVNNTDLRKNNTYLEFCEGHSITKSKRVCIQIWRCIMVYLISSKIIAITDYH